MCAVKRRLTGLRVLSAIFHNGLNVMAEVNKKTTNVRPCTRVCVCARACVFVVLFVTAKSYLFSEVQ